MSNVEFPDDKEPETPKKVASRATMPRANIRDTAPRAFVEVQEDVQEEWPQDPLSEEEEAELLRDDADPALDEGASGGESECKKKGAPWWWLLVAGGGGAGLAYLMRKK